MLKSALVGGLGSGMRGNKKPRYSESDESVEMLMSLSRWLPPLHSSPASSSLLGTSACWTVITSEASGGLQELWEKGTVFCRSSLALMRAFSMVRSSRAM